ncbi:MAG: hypothetical protein LBJ82_06735, partial [Deltaproteobacteria bacterium]|nr:hypothetical protein [Deltaproteobacteria bacterium]
MNGTPVSSGRPRAARGPDGQSRLPPALRMGRIGYLNVLPVYLALECGAIDHGYELARGSPAALNALLAKGRLLAASISS